MSRVDSKCRLHGNTARGGCDDDGSRHGNGERWQVEGRALATGRDRDAGGYGDGAVVAGVEIDDGAA